MVRDDEKLLWAELKRRTLAGGEMPWGRELAKELGINTKRAEYLFLKWAARDWYDYGVHCLAGWLTEKGLAAELPE